MQSQSGFNPANVLTEVWGKDFVAMSHKRAADEAVNEQNYKLSLIKNINKNRKLMNQEECLILQY